MNREAERRLDKATGYLDRGEGLYRKAADEVIAARDADPTLTIKAAGERIGRSEAWVKKLLAWALDPEQTEPTPYSGSKMSARKDVEKTRRILREAPLEQVEQIITTLPRERKLAIAAELGDVAAKQRHEFEERERNMPPAERKAREAAAQTVRTGVAVATAGFDTFGIVNHLEQATTILGEMVGNGVISTDGMAKVDAALAAFLDEYRVAMAMTGQEASA